LGIFGHLCQIRIGWAQLALRGKYFLGIRSICRRAATGIEIASHFQGPFPHRLPRGVFRRKRPTSSGRTTDGIVVFRRSLQLDVMASMKSGKAILAEDLTEEPLSGRGRAGNAVLLA